jgi:type I restriction enzyme S subunit
MSLDLDKNGWKRVRLGQVICRSRKQINPLEGGTDRYVAGGHIDGESMTIERWGDVNDGQMGSTFRYVFTPGQILFVSARPYLRKTGVANFSGVVADKTYVLDAAPENGLLQSFLPFVLSSEPFVEYATTEATGSMNPRLLWGSLQRYEFDLPPLDEQKRIADLLWAVEYHRRSCTASLSAVEAAISDYCRYTYLRLDAGAPCVPITAIADLRMGRQKSPKYLTGNHATPYLRVANVGCLELELDQVEEMDFDVAERKKFALQTGDIVLTEGDIVSAMNVGRPALYRGEISPLCFQNTLIRLRPINDTVAEFLLALCEGMRLCGVFAGAASTTTVTHLGLRRLCEVKVPQVSAEAQESVADSLTRLLHARVAARSELAAIEKVRARISAELFA